MSKSNSIKVPRVMPRNPLALVARQRRAGFMHDRRAPRGGARNEQADLLDQAQEDMYDDWDW